LYGKTIPSGNEGKVSTLMKHIRKGKDLTPYQSRSLTNRKLNKHDKMLNDWGIHHLHLHPNGTSAVLMCHVRDDALYAIGFWPHNNWDNAEIVNELIDSWPELFEGRLLHGVTPTPFSDTQRRNLRADNANALIHHPTQGVYRPIGGGLNCSGGSSSATLEFCLLKHFVWDIEKWSVEQAARGAWGHIESLRLMFNGHKPVAILDGTSGQRLVTLVDQ
jgi:hypothetical protein